MAKGAEEAFHSDGDEDEEGGHCGQRPGGRELQRPRSVCTACAAAFCHLQHRPPFHRRCITVRKAPLPPWPAKASTAVKVWSIYTWWMQPSARENLRINGPPSHVALRPKSLLPLCQRIVLLMKTCLDSRHVPGTQGPSSEIPQWRHGCSTVRRVRLSVGRIDVIDWDSFMAGAKK